MSNHTNIKIFLDTTNTDRNTLVHRIHPAQYLFQLPSPIVVKPLQRDYDISIGLESLSLCLTQYVVNSNSDSIYINNKTLVLEHGNYDVDEFVLHLNELLIATPTLTDIRVANNDKTNRLTFSSTSSTTSLTFPINETNTAHKLAGIVQSADAKPLPYTCERTIALYASTGVSVRINNLTNMNQNVNGGTSSIIRLPSAQSFTVLNHFSNDPFMSRISDKQFSYIDISLHDDDDNLLDIQDGHPWFVCLRCNFTPVVETLKDKKIITP